MKFYFLLYFLTSLSLSLTSDLKDLINEITSGRNTLSNDEINEYVLKNNLNQDENILILNGLIEIDGEKSFNFFNDYYSDSEKKYFNELALRKICEYYYTKGLYVKSSIWYKKLITKFPDSKKMKSSINFYLNSLSVSGKLDSAKFYSKLLHDKYPDLKFNKKFYESNINKPKISIINESNYSVEVSSHETYSKASSVKSILSSEGFSARIVEKSINGKKMYFVRVGLYINKKNAENIKKRIKSRLGISNLVVVEEKND